MLYNLSFDVLSDKSTSQENNVLLKLPNNDVTTQNIPTESEEEMSDPFVFTTSIPSVSPQPPGIDLSFDNNLETTTLDSLIANSRTTNFIELSTLKDDFNLEDNDTIEDDQINITVAPLNSSKQVSLSNDFDNKTSEGVNNFSNFDINDQYVSLISKEAFITTTPANELNDNDELDNLDDNEIFLNTSSTTTILPKMVNENIPLTTEVYPTNITSTSEEVHLNNSDKFIVDEYNGNSIENKYTNDIKKLCPEVEICNPGCGISIDFDGCQKCTCLWIPNFCIETSDCNGPEYICEYGKCLCDINYTQDMERSGICIPKPNSLKQNDV
ncbi:Hypothetical protein SRAE_1000122800 [Strongyloides ratti]|uniref:Uncharacterized protein n=1 Tax=Strongyloides ratti TaxID=34506 RepID=A0A090L4B6_STRRB|nr:Hypothetical protein SRAE_1000122800 [Strongyloides ratti]CEF62962.1 Hypothetical protein SRAE_1000122800 [Strongyloides ratti]